MAGLAWDWLTPAISYFDRVFDGEDLAGGFVEDGQHGRERRGLAAAGRPGHHDHAVGEREQLAQLCFVVRQEAELFDGEQAAVLGQEAYYCRLAVLRRHDGDADVEVGARHVQPRCAVLRQAALRDVEAGENLDAGNDGLRQHARRRRNGAQQSVDAQAHRQARPEGLDVNVAGAQLDGLFQEIAHGADHRRPGGEVAQALDVVLARIGGVIVGLRRCRVIVAEPLIERRLDVLERGDLDLHVAAEHDAGGADRGGIARIGDRENRLALRRLKRKHQHLAQEAPGELVRQRRRRQQVGQADARHLEESRDLVGEIIGRKIGQSPQLVQGAFVLGLRSSGQRIAVARKMILAKVVRELMCKIRLHARLAA